MMRYVGGMKWDRGSGNRANKQGCSGFERGLNISGRQPTPRGHHDRSFPSSTRRRPGRNFPRTRWRAAVMRGLYLCGVLTLLACLGRREASAQDTAAEEPRRRAMVMAQLPPDAAKILFGRESTPAAGPPQAIGSYERGCLSGAIALPADGPNWQVMRPSRNRAWGHPVLIAFLERLAQKLPGEAGWPGLLVGDIAQPRGGPMLTGHGSHQIGLDADIWLTPMPNRRLSPAERDEISATDVVAADGMDVDHATWTPQHRRLLRPLYASPWWRG